MLLETEVWFTFACMTETARLVAEAYRWQRRLGHRTFETRHCHIVACPDLPDVWDANHADGITAESEAEVDDVFGAMDAHLAHCPWRVVHTDSFTPDGFVARLALEGFGERPVTIQMALSGEICAPPAVIDLRPVISDADWDELRRLLVIDYAEGRRTGDLDLSPEFASSAVAAYRAKEADYRFNLVMADESPIAFGAYALAPNGVGMIEDLFTLPAARRRGVATAMIASFTDHLRGRGCTTVFLGALASEQPKHLYARLGFRPIGLARTWVLAKTSRS